MVSETTEIILYVVPGSPAARAGLQRRDHIVAADGTPIDPQGKIDKIYGPVGMPLRLSVRSPGQASRDVILTREQIQGDYTASAHRLATDPTIGYLELPDFFSDNRAQQVDAGLRRLLSNGPLQGLIIDLRANSGGQVQIAKEVLGDFMQGEAGAFYSHTTREPFIVAFGPLAGPMTNMPLVILVDQGTRSAAEIVAGALQAAGRAQVVGVPTAGTTEELIGYEFRDGSRLWLAEAAFKLPDGTDLEGRGVQPDVRVEVDWTEYSEDTDPQILKAVELLHAASPP
jgi:C-terminal peptidase prc